MSIFKCKMCGGTLEIHNNETVATCEYCGTKQTLPRLDDEKRANLYDRANHFRRNNEFDKAAALYEQIVAEDTNDAEAYWSLVLCRYGIEYVADPATRKRVPTVNRAQFTSIYADTDYQAALKHADGYQRTVYEEEAKAIDEIQKGILAISQKEEPFDVFICYKETDNNGRRTPDSVLANDLYHQLTQEGFKVFFARITLEDKLGSAYEPYIFAALNSAKVMVVLGTKPEYFNAVWVKNEWSRFLALTKDGKKTLIPAYKDMDPYDLPEEFSHLQAQDMAKLGFMQDLIRGIKKLAHDNDNAVVPGLAPVTHVAETCPSVDLLLKRTFRFLEDGDWNSANEYCEKVLDINPDCAEAYVGKFMAELHVHKREELANCTQAFEQKSNYKNALRLATPQLAKELAQYAELAGVNHKKQNKKKAILFILAAIFLALIIFVLIFIFIIIPNGNYNDALALKNAGRYSEAIVAFQELNGYKDSEDQIKECKYQYALELTQQERFGEAYAYFYELKDYKDSAEQIEKYKERMLQEQYDIALGLMTNGQYAEAIKAFETLSGFKDSASKITQCEQMIAKEEQYNNAVLLMNAGKYSDAITAFKALNGYKDSAAKITACETAVLNQKYNNAVSLMNAGKYSEAITAFKALNGYKDSAIKITACETEIKNAELNSKYNNAVSLMNAGKYSEAITAFEKLNGYSDSVRLIDKCKKEMIKNPKIGDVVYFGTYEQDKNTANGQEEIEWIVLDKKDGKALIISKYGLDCQQYNTARKNVTWETCTLRNWLNTTFYTTAFSVNQQSKIISTTITNANNPSYGTYGGNKTTDKVFLLSIDEAKQYFATKTARVMTATAYATAQGAMSYDGSSTWWVRLPGIDGYRAAYVNRDGSVDDYGNVVDYNGYAVRPALWINLES